MDGVIFGFYTLSIILFVGMANSLMGIYKPGIYPPKKVLRKRASVLASGGIFTLLIAILLTVIR
ncbi:MAG TPA: hypothetical protein VEY51_21360 [Chondromyces sp.]|nr:hypothetical protein [Chondromyces sp.]